MLMPSPVVYRLEYNLPNNTIPPSHEVVHRWNLLPGILSLGVCVGVNLERRTIASIGYLWFGENSYDLHPEDLEVEY